MIYLASPYTHEDPEVMQTRFMQTAACAAHFIRAGHYIYSPIVHCHPLAGLFNLPENFDFWKEYNFDLLSSANELWVLKLLDWNTSRGVLAESRFALENGIRVRHLENINASGRYEFVKPFIPNAGRSSLDI